MVGVKPGTRYQTSQRRHTKQPELLSGVGVCVSEKQRIRDMYDTRSMRMLLVHYYKHCIAACLRDR